MDLYGKIVESKVKAMGKDNDKHHIFPYAIFCRNFTRAYQNRTIAAYMVYQTVNRLGPPYPNVRHFYVPIFYHNHWHTIMVSLHEKIYIPMSLKKMYSHTKMRVTKW